MIGGVIGAGGTLAKDLIKNEKLSDIDYKEVGVNAARGAIAGAMIGSGAEIVGLVADAVCADTTIATAGYLSTTGFKTRSKRVLGISLYTVQYLELFVLQFLILLIW